MPRYQLTPRRKRRFKIMLILTLVLGVINGFTGGNFIHSFMKVVYLMVGLQLIMLFVTFQLSVVKVKATNGASLTTFDHIHEYYKNVFTENGYQVDYEALRRIKMSKYL